ncbi:LacI family DNA-binding transcriptional regulator [Rugosimonospora africana]|uniref:LacI family transcriptional regulator n=1 Tax=Rugosimonospora africana TaxID=556532 RepID=A0A8J3VSP8_9ACTN|nr:LacI family DNA-binding transcriptional regulator [Rugosimonospora africana]GIH17562.1 LacI family transcriptional regulator [Rugosimonospora africana]
MTAVTLQDVATEAGVSLATASRALHGGTRVVTAELRERVEQAARDLGYTSHGPAQALARATTPVVGLIVHDIADPYFSAMAIGAMRAAHESGLLVLVCNTFRDPALELDYVARLRAQRARGVLLFGSGFTERSYQSKLHHELDLLAGLGGRVACISPHGFATDAVLPEHRDGGRLAAGHLAALGHRRIGVISGPANLLVNQERLRGFRDQLRALDIELPQEQIAKADFTREGGRAAAVELMGRVPGLTAIFALNDVMAIGVLAALRDELKLSVPDDVSVVGFDDIALTVDVQPALSTVHLPLEEIGRHGMRLLLEEAPTGTRTVRVPASLVHRESSAPPRD